MKKTVQISLAKSLFTVEDDAYQKLDEYLRSVKAHFLHTEGKDEIIQDIEDRIAEQFLETGVSIITLAEVEQVITSMGTVEQFEDDESAAESSQQKVQTMKKKLYRNPDNSVIAGVASGLAAYFGIEPLLVRLAFVLLAFANGIGVLAYVVLLLIMPAAKTASQKLEMQGSDVTLESLSEVSRTTSGNDTVVMRFFSALGAVIRIAFAAFCFVGALSALAGLVFALPYIISFPFDTYIDFPVWEVISVPQFYLGLVTGYVAVIIPLICILVLGVSLLRKKYTLSPVVGYWALGIWTIAAIVATFTLSSASVSFHNYRMQEGAEDIVTKTMPLDGEIHNVVVSNGQSLKLIQGATPSLVVSGKRRTLQNYDYSLSDGILTLSVGKSQKPCLFCEGYPDYILTVPKLDSIKLYDKAHLYSRNWTGDDLSLEVQQRARADITISVKNLDVITRLAGVVDIAGSASGVTMQTHDASGIRAEGLVADRLKVTATKASMANVTAVESLEMTAENGGTIRYTGDAKTTIQQRAGRVVKID